MIIAVPTSIKIFNWIATMWGGKISIKAPLLYAVGFISMFIIGGLSGVSLAVVPIDWQVTDTYYVVAHIHYVLFGGAVFAIFAALFYWFPKMTGRLLDDRLGQIQFWIMFVGFNLTFFPMHILGLLGMPRRIYTYGSGLGWDTWNLAETIGAFIIALSIGVFVWNFLISIRSGQRAGDDPWDGHTLEWTTTSPPPAYNFATIPTVQSRRPFWDKKHSLAVTGKPVAAKSAGQHGSGDSAKDPSHGTPHLPAGSFNPLIITVGLTIAAYGMIFAMPLALLGVAVVFWGVIAWVREPR
jgi:cytochrome c oxidase subunit 1